MKANASSNDLQVVFKAIKNDIDGFLAGWNSTITGEVGDLTPSGLRLMQDTSRQLDAILRVRLRPYAASTTETLIEFTNAEGQMLEPDLKGPLMTHCSQRAGSTVNCVVAGGGVTFDRT